MFAGSKHLIYREPSFDFTCFCTYFFLTILFPSCSRFSVCYCSTTLHAFMNRSSRCFFSFHFTSKHCFHSGFVDFRLSARFLRQDRVGYP